jgi:hypothetical protein
VAPYTVQTILNGTPTGGPVAGVTGPVYGISSSNSREHIRSPLPIAMQLFETTNAVDVTTPATPAFTAFTDATCNGDSNVPYQQSGVAPPTFDLSGTGSIQEMLTVLHRITSRFLYGCNHGCKRMYFPSSCSDYNAEPVVVSATISVTTPLSCGAVMQRNQQVCSRCRRKCSVPIQFQQPGCTK